VSHGSPRIIPAVSRLVACGKFQVRHAGSRAQVVFLANKCFLVRKNRNPLYVNRLRDSRFLQVLRILRIVAFLPEAVVSDSASGVTSPTELSIRSALH
jgi:hypothetical protein